MGGTSLYVMIPNLGTKIYEICTAACDTDSLCAFFDIAYDNTCVFYESDGLSQMVQDSTYNAYIKSGYSFISG